MNIFSDVISLFFEELVPGLTYVRFYLYILLFFVCEFLLGTLIYYFWLLIRNHNKNKSKDKGD